jgi:carbonic anhydrase
MEKSFQKMLKGYKVFREKYVYGDASVMQQLFLQGQKPEIMVVACCDSRVDPALILDCKPGDLFVVRNVANIVPPFTEDQPHLGTSAALEFAICSLKVKHLILLGHSQCGGIEALLNNSLDQNNPNKDDFITKWVSLIKTNNFDYHDPDNCAKLAIDQSYKNCMTFPWINQRVKSKELVIHSWFFDIKLGQIFTHSEKDNIYKPLDY